MKRFYCTVCKRIKRVRKYPVSVDNIDSISPTSRIGRCKWHDAPVYQHTRQLVEKVGR